MNRKAWKKWGFCAVKSFSLALAAEVFLAAGSRKGYGAESSVIESVTVNIKTDCGEQGEIPDPEITVSGNGCSGRCPVPDGL